MQSIARAHRVYKRLRAAIDRGRFLTGCILLLMLLRRRPFLFVLPREAHEGRWIVCCRLGPTKRVIVPSHLVQLLAMVLLLKHIHWALGVELPFLVQLWCIVRAALTDSEGVQLQLWLILATPSMVLLSQSLHWVILYDQWLYVRVQSSQAGRHHAQIFLAMRCWTGSVDQRVSRCPIWLEEELLLLVVSQRVMSCLGLPMRISHRLRVACDHSTEGSGCRDCQTIDYFVNFFDVFSNAMYEDLVPLLYTLCSLHLNHILVIV